MAKGWLEALLGKAQKFVDAREEELSRMRGVDRLYIFGAGATSRQLLAQLWEQGCRPAAFCDNNADKAGTVIDGVHVISFAQLCNEIRERELHRIYFRTALLPGNLSAASGGKCP